MMEYQRSVHLPTEVEYKLLISMSFSYIDPDVIMNEDQHTTDIQRAPAVDFDEVFSRIDAYFTIIDSAELLGGGLAAAEKYKYSFYKNIWKVAPYSHIIDPAAYKNTVIIMTQLLSKYVKPRSELQAQLLTRFLGVESLMYYMKDAQPFNLFLRLNVLDKDTGKYKPDIKNNYSHYKIHLCVKEEYAFYALLKLALVIYPIFDKSKYLEIKWNMAMRTTKITEGDTEFIRDNGGPTATIILYTQSPSAEVVKSYLDAIIKAFPEETEIGLMNLDGHITLPYGNVRLNHLVCYAQGDRENKIKTMRDNLTKEKDQRTKKILPPWLAEIASRGDNKLSQLYLGLDITSLDGWNNRGVDKIHYLAFDDTLLDPQTVGSAAGGNRQIKGRKNRTSKRKSRK